MTDLDREKDDDGIDTAPELRLQESFDDSGLNLSDEPTALPPAEMDPPEEQDGEN